MKNNLLFFISLFIFSCTSTSDIEKKIVKSNFYSSEIFSPSYYLYHNEENSSQLFFNIDPSEVLFIRDNPEQPFQSKIEFQINILKKGERKFEIIDTIQKQIITINESTKKTIISGTIDLPLNNSNQYKLEIKSIDSNKNKGSELIIYVDKTNNKDRYNFLVTDRQTSNPIYNYQKIGSGQVNIECNRCKDISFSTYEINKSDVKLPPPPYANRVVTLPELPDETIETDFFEDGYGYFITSDPEKKEGVTISVNNTYFPEIKTFHNMALTARYITTKSEYEELLTSKNQKNSLDDFWIKRGGSAERGKQMINIYYSRVGLANSNFSELIPGWKTDRGTIYIIYGKPNEIRKFDERETWIYGDVTNPNSLSFTFYKVKNKYSENRYELARNSAYRVHWQRAVTNWINGRIYERK